MVAQVPQFFVAGSSLSTTPIKLYQTQVIVWVVLNIGMCGRAALEFLCRHNRNFKSWNDRASWRVG
jgi:hypothetical protein